MNMGPSRAAEILNTWKCRTWKSSPTQPVSPPTSIIMPFADTSLPESNVDVLIVGAGPAGLMMAEWMAKCGMKTRIVDKRGTKARSQYMHVPADSLTACRSSMAKPTAYNAAL